MLSLFSQQVEHQQEVDHLLRGHRRCRLLHRLAADQVRETEAMEWVNALAGDMENEAR